MLILCKMMKNVLQFLKKRKYILAVLVFAFIVFNLYYMTHKIENFESKNNGLIKTDALVEKLRKKIGLYDQMVKKMKDIEKEIIENN